MATKKELKLNYHGEIQIRRDENGVPGVIASTPEDMYFGQGYLQACDRGVQMILMRLIAQGRLSEFFNPTDELLETDIFFRKMNWSGDLDKLPPPNQQTERYVNAWCAGINTCFNKQLPFFLRFVGYQYEPWKKEDAILLSRLIGYIGLQQTQSEMERFIIEMIQTGVSDALIEELFPDCFAGVDRKIIEKIKLTERIIPESVKWNVVIPRLTGSNNWALAPQKTFSNKAILAADPHLEGNRIPNVMQEVLLQCKERYMAGVSIPGMPGILIGRNNDVAWSATYSFMDSVDSWIEECREGKFWRGSKSRTEWIRFKERKEIIRRKKRESKMVIFYENEHGVLEGAPFVHGYYLTAQWAGGANTGIRSLESIFSLFNIHTVKEGMERLGAMETSWNWVLADAKGNIGYQMSGLLPKRNPEVNGLLPVPGWDTRYDWKGFYNWKDLPQSYNPREGFIVTANNNMNRYGKVSPINLSMGSYRSDRITELLSQDKKFDLKDMADIQYDLHSNQADLFLFILLPLLEEEDEHAKILRDWDRRYSPGSKGAEFFESFYKSLFMLVFGKIIGDYVIKHIFFETPLMMSYYGHFDKILLAKRSAWFGDATQEELYLAAYRMACNGKNRPDADENKIELNHIISSAFKFLGFFLNRKSIRSPGGRATVFQLQRYKSGKRDLRLAPVYRMLVDFSLPGIRSNLLGGPSESFLSRFYLSDVSNWLNGRYRKVVPEESDSSGDL